MSAEAIPLPPTIQGLGDLTDANDGQHGLVDGEAGIASQGQGQSQEQHSDRQTDSSNANVAPREHLYDQDHTHTEHDPEKKTIISPVQPHPNATADDTSNTLAGSNEHSTRGKSHQMGEGYSGHNKVPTVASFRDEQAHLKEEAEKRNDELEKQQFDEELERRQQMKQEQGEDVRLAEHSGAAPAPPTKSGTIKADRPHVGSHTHKDKEKSEGQKEKEELMNRMAPPKREKPSDKVNKQGRRTVTDPVTGMPVTIEAGDKLGQQTMKMYDVANSDPEAVGDSPATHRPKLNKSAQDGGGIDEKDTSPAPAKPGNILFQPFPAPVEPASAAGYKGALDKASAGVCAGLGLVWIFTAFGSGILRLLFRSFLIGTLAIGVVMLNGLTKKNIEHSIERVRLDMHRKRGEKHSPPVPESVEYLNALLSTIWRLINPEMFVSTIDMVEDVMQASLPGIIDAVKISDYGQGSNPVRIISMRGLPDRTTDKDYPKEEWIDQGEKQTKKDADERDKLSKTTEEQDMDEAGDYVNLEIAVAYQARPGQNLKQHNIHLLLEFFIGFYDWFNIPIPIWAQVEGFAATVRLRMQMVPDAPFIRNLTFTLMGIPKVDVSVQPMISHFPNVLDLPLISGFVQSSIAAAAAEYVAPKSMTLNVAQIISGGGIKKDTKALGVLAITIHYASNLSAQDSNGKSDPYIVLAYAKFGKPLYSTRIIIEDLNPVWEETAFLLLSDDEVKAGEDLAVMLWDSDKRSADDLIGRVSVPVVDLMLKPNQVFERTDNLTGFQDAKEMQGTLTWSIAFYDKAPFNPSLKRDINYDLPPEVRNRPELQDNNATAADTTAESDAMSIPPDPAFPAGILSVIVHQVNNLERQNLTGATGGDREGQAGQDTDAPSEEGQNLPSSYAEIVLNDELIYKTRVKQYSSQPFFEAGVERFVRDWRSAVVRIVMRDSRLREHDPILGIVTLRVKDILSTRSQVTRLYAIQDGVGFGRVNVSLLFRSVEAKIPRNYLGWNTGTIEVLSDLVFEPAEGLGDEAELKTLKLRISTSDGNYKVKTSHAQKEGDARASWKLDEVVRLPVYDRYASALMFDIGPGTKVLGFGPDSNAAAALWFQDLVDDEEEEVRIPVIRGENLDSLKHNILNKETAQHHDYKVIGYLICTVKLDSGLDPDHEKYAKTQAQRHQFETYQNAEGLAEIAEKNSHAMDDGVIDKQEQKELDRAHKQQLRHQQRGIYPNSIHIASPMHTEVPMVRTAVWSKDGLKERGRKIKNVLTGSKSRDNGRAVESEA